MLTQMELPFLALCAQSSRDDSIKPQVLRFNPNQHSQHVSFTHLSHRPGPVPLPRCSPAHRPSLPQPRPSTGAARSQGCPRVQRAATGSPPSAHQGSPTEVSSTSAPTTPPDAEHPRSCPYNQATSIQSEDAGRADCGFCLT